MDQNGLRSGLPGGGEQMGGVGNYGLHRQRGSLQPDNSFLKIDDYDGGAFWLQLEIDHD